MMGSLKVVIDQRRNRIWIECDILSGGKCVLK